MEKFRRQFGERLKAARKEAGLSQARLGELIGGADLTTVGRWERGLSLPDDGRFKRICRVLKKPREYFLGESQPLPPTIRKLFEIIEEQEKRITELERGKRRR